MLWSNSLVKHLNNYILSDIANKRFTFVEGETGCPLTVGQVFDLVEKADPYLDRVGVYYDGSYVYFVIYNSVWSNTLPNLQMPSDITRNLQSSFQVGTSFRVENTNIFFMSDSSNFVKGNFNLFKSVRSL